MLENVARWSFRHRRWMLLLWVVALVAFIGLQLVAGGKYSTDFSLPGAESQKALDVLKERFPEQAGDTADIVFKADAGVTDPAVQKRMEGLFAELADLRYVLRIDSPYSEAGQRQIAPDGTIAFATVHFERIEGDQVPVSVIKKLMAEADAAEGGGVVIEPGGPLVQFGEFENPGGGEGIAILAAMIILVIAFGSVIAMGLPILSALFGIGIGISMVLLFANFLSVPNFTPQLASMIGIGVGIDYALFIVTRYRQLLHQGMDPEPATLVALTTSGRAVVFAGITVVISLLGILLMGFAFVEGVAVGGAATVAVTMLASITLLPAMLGFVGHNIDKWRLPLFHSKEIGDETSMMFRWSRVIQRRPVIMLLTTLVVIVTLSLPLFSINLGFPDAGTNDVDRSSRRAYDLLSEGFGPGFNGPLLLAADVDDPQALETLNSLSQQLAEVPGVAAVTPPFPNEAGDAAIITVFPTTSPQDQRTNALVTRLRDDEIPGALNGADVHVYVGGQTAAAIDFAEVNGQRLPILIGVVIALSFLLLVGVFRSIVVPAKAALMNLLSIGAAYGVIVAIFQWGWGKDLLGVHGTGPIDAWVPMMLFTILFGLSMDYEIFLLSRIREEYVRTKDNALAVANGVASTGRVITAAAAIMVTVFLSFVFGFEERSIKLFGMGLAVAVFVDATLIRMVLVPATMELLGDLNWWFPKWLARLVPQIQIESEEHVVQHVLEEAAAEDKEKETEPV
ncbi:MAG TPA: MMPL family transporter [Actinomycetota bacterium]|nr:MMPL family transporter [Actinomycetota bacterium]